jgi:hypothetical protein
LIEAPGASVRIEEKTMDVKSFTEDYCSISSRDKKKIRHTAAEGHAVIHNMM